MTRLKLMRLLAASTLVLGVDLASNLPETQASTMDQAVAAALGRPGTVKKKLKFNGHGFNIHAVKRSSVNGKVVLKGRISHRLRLRDDDQIDYTLTYNADGSLADVSVKLKKSYLNRALKFIAKELWKVIKEEIADSISGDGKEGSMTSALKKLNPADQLKVLEKTIARVEKEIGSGGWEKEAAKIVANIAVRAEPTNRSVRDRMGYLRYRARLAASKKRPQSNGRRSPARNRASKRPASRSSRFRRRR